MSVTFSIEAIPTGTFSVTCYDATTPFVTGVSYDEANMAILVHQEACQTCQCYRPFARADVDLADEMEVNFHNAGASRVLAALGYGVEATDDPYAEVELCGTADGQDFLGRVLVALAAAPQDPGSPERVRLTPAGGLLVELARPSGYLQERLALLEPMAREAARLGRSVTWG